MRKKLSKLLCVMLVLLLTVQTLPLNVFAETLNASADEVISLETSENGVITPELAADAEELRAAEIVDELTEKRTEYSKEYRLDNGLHMATVYAEPIHYADNDQWEDIDNTLKTAAGSTLTNTAGIWNVSFPQQMSSGKAVTITKDGYTLSFYMAGRLQTPSGGAVVASASATAEQFSISQSLTAQAQIQEVDLSILLENASFPETVPAKLYSRLQYENVYSGTNIVYDLVSNRVKESIVMAAYDAALRGYRYTLNTGSMIPVLSDSGEITLYGEDQETVIMTMPAPFLLDAAGEYSEDVTVTLTGSNGTYTLTYLLPQDWLSDSQRSWPVILDPIVEGDTTRTNIKDITAYENNVNNSDYNTGVLDVGRTPTYGIMRSYIKYQDLPELTAADILVCAELEMTKPSDSNVYTAIEAHKVLSTWESETLTWANQPGGNSIVEDHVNIRYAGTYKWDITDIARDWYEGENRGLLLKISDELETASTNPNVHKQFYSSDFGLIYKPTLYLFFRNNNGLESYWDYTTSSAGRAGTGYINKYTGNLVWVRSDIGFGGNRMPVTINHVYNANDSQNNEFGMGYGWRTNFNQKVYQWTADTNYYVWEDSDGTDHYFKLESTGTYKDEDGLELTLTTTGSDTQKYCITDKGGNKSYFDAKGRLTSQQNNQATKSSITIAYTDAEGLLISSITDGVGRKYNFSYSSGLLSKITCFGIDSTELTNVSFSYNSSSLLTEITDKDGGKCTYAYESNNLLKTVQDVDGYQVRYTYTTVAAGQPNRVATVSEYDGTTLGGKLTMAYARNQTTITDNRGNMQILQFNNWGNTIAIQDNQGRAQYAQYANNGQVGVTSTAKGNQLNLSSDLQNTVASPVYDGSFEYGTYWNALSTAVSSAASNETAYIGNYSLKMTRTTAGTASGVRLIRSVPANSTYTFSAYVKVVNGSTAYLEIDDESGTAQKSETLSAGNEWKRLEVSYTNTTSAAVSVTMRLMTATAGTVYMDCVQIELAETASRFNLVGNGDFYSNGLWTTSNCTSADVRTTISALGATKAPAQQLDENVYKVTGASGLTKRVYQDVPVSGIAGDTFVFGGWAKGNAVPLYGRNGGVREFGIRATFYDSNGTAGATQVAYFNPDAGDVWQYTAGVVVATAAYSKVRIEMVFGYNANYVLFDGIQLYKEEFGSSYTYDDNGNVISVKDLQGKTTSYEYSSNNLTKEILPTGAQMTYTYDSYHNVKTATTDTGITYYFDYDTYGNNTEVRMAYGTTTLKSSATYKSNGNYLLSTVDSMGNITSYDYNDNTGVLISVQYPNDTDATKTQYTYDTMYRMATAAATTNNGNALSATYTYEDDLLKTIQTPTTTYTFSYGLFSQRSSIKVGSRTLASYTYDYTATPNAATNSGLLTRLDYGNGDSVSYTYDNQGRVTKQTYTNELGNTESTVTYKYDNDGALATVTDSESGISTTCYYDFSNRLMKYMESSSGGDHIVGYGYDTLNNLTSLVETINGTKHTTAYTYDADNRVTEVTNGSATETYSYDGFNRVTQHLTKHGSDTVLTDTMAYRTESGATTGQVSTLTSAATGYNVTYTYAYDNNGNILSVSDGTNTTSYVYDTANQLVRENNQAAGKTWTWTYDNAGNITSRKEYSYTTGTLGTASSTVAYTYGDSTWKDLLTNYGGKTIIYDTIGNPTSDGTWTYTWKHGRELATMKSGSTTWTFTYNADGIRTKRTNGSTTYTYVYNGGSLSQMTVGSNTLYFAYDANGAPMSVTYNGTAYYYATNLQGDVVAILTSAGTAVVRYTYDAWGKLLSTTGTMASTLGVHNPLRYRGYVYDTETGLYYLQSRYYNPTIGRFINADSVIAGASGSVQGYNMFAYCFNNPVNMSDYSGHWPQWVENTWKKVKEFFSSDSNSIEGEFESGVFRGSGSLTGGYTEFNWRLDDKIKSSRSQDGWIGGFGKASIGNANGKVGIGNSNLSASLKGVADGLVATAQAGLHYKDGLGIGAKTKASVLSGRATTEFNIFGWQVEVGVSGDVLSVGAEATIGIFPTSDGGKQFDAKCNVSTGWFGWGYVVRIKAPA